MKLKLFLDTMEKIAPASLAYSFDNVGLLIGPDHEDVKNVLVALDLSDATAREAVSIGADLVLTHHPIMFNPVKHILPDDPEMSAAYILMRNGIGHFAAHTNLDKAQGGVNDVLADLIGLKDITADEREGLIRFGELQEQIPLTTFSQSCRDKLGVNVRYTGVPEALCKKIAVCGGAGNGLFDFVKEAHADTFLTGEIKHSEAILYKNAGISVITAGHYETERCVLLPLINRLQMMTDDVKYNLTQSESSYFCCI